MQHKMPTLCAHCDRPSRLHGGCDWEGGIRASRPIQNVVPQNSYFLKRAVIR